MANNNVHISVGELFEKHGERLSLQWVAGKNGGGNIITPEEYRSKPRDNSKYDINDHASEPAGSEIRTPGKSLAGYLNLIHPHQIQILGNVELDYLEQLRDITRHDTVKQLISHAPACMIMAEK